MSVVNADEITPDTAHEGMLRPADAQLTNYTFWQPEIDGLARYRLHLPPRGIEIQTNIKILPPCIIWRSKLIADYMSLEQLTIV